MTENGEYNLISVVTRTSKVLYKYGLRDVHNIQKVAGILIYPKDYFCPKSPDTGEIILTNNTCTIHHFNGSWWPDGARFKRKLIAKGVPAPLAYVLSQSIYFPKHVVQHLVNGTFWQQVKKHMKNQ